MNLGPNPSGYCLCGCGSKTPISPRNQLPAGAVKGTPAKYASHACRNRARTGFATTEERFAARVDRSGGPDACWPWLGYVNGHGQGTFAATSYMPVYAHRFAYQLWVGPIPEGLQLDHLCHTRDPSCLLADGCPHRSCCNPAHLEPVTARTNVLRAHLAPTAINARKTHCLRGHEFAGDNLIVDSQGHRHCRECRRRKDRLKYAAAISKRGAA